MYLLTTSHPFPTEPWKQLGAHICSPHHSLRWGNSFLRIPAGSSFQSLCDEAERILRRIFEEYVDMIGFHCNLDYFYIKFFAGLADNAFRNHRHISCQYLSSIFRGTDHVICLVKDVLEYSQAALASVSIPLLAPASCQR